MLPQLLKDKLNKKMTKKERAEQQDLIIREVIRNALYTKTEVDLDNIEHIVNKNTAEERIFQEKLRNRKRRLKRSKKSTPSLIIYL